MKWFKYTGYGDVNSPLNYKRYTYPYCPSPKVHLCAIYAAFHYVNGLPRPIIDEELQLLISVAVSSGMESDRVTLRP